MNGRWAMALLVSFVLLFPSLAASQSQPSQLSTKTVSWRPDIEFDGQLFPAFVLAMASRKVTVTDPLYIGDPNGVIGVRARSKKPDVRFHVSVAVDGLSTPSVLDGALTEANKEYRIFPRIRYDFRALTQIAQSYPTNVQFTFSVDGEPAEQETVPVQVRAVHDVPYYWQSENGKTHDLTFLFGSFVNENHPSIDRLLAEALRHKAITSFVGYQGGSSAVEHQLFAIWNVLQRRGVRYSSITRASGESPRVRSQHVRFLDEAVENAQANCVDGSVLFASVLYKLAMCPVLVLIPGHMFVGVHTDAASCGKPGNLLFLETTLIGNPGLNATERKWTFLTRNGYQSSESYRQYVTARRVGEDRFRSFVPHLQAKEPGYHVIEISLARGAGVAAIAHSPIELFPPNR
jgi:hypothetical protein